MTPPSPLPIPQLGANELLPVRKCNRETPSCHCVLGIVARPSQATARWVRFPMGIVGSKAEVQLRNTSFMVPRSNVSPGCPIGSWGESDSKLTCNRETLSNGGRTHVVVVQEPWSRAEVIVNLWGDRVLKPWCNRETPKAPVGPASDPRSLRDGQLVLQPTAIQGGERRQSQPYNREARLGQGPATSAFDGGDHFGPYPMGGAM